MNVQAEGMVARRAQCCNGRIQEIILLRCTQSETVGQISAVGVLITNHSTMPPPVSLSRSDERRVELATPFVRWAQCRVGLSVRSTFSCPSTHALAAQRSASHRLVASLQRVVPPFLTFLPIFSTRRSRAWLGWLLRATARVGATALSRVRTLAPVVCRRGGAKRLVLDLQLRTLCEALEAVLRGFRCGGARREVGRTFAYDIP